MDLDTWLQARITKAGREYFQRAASRAAPMVRQRLELICGERQLSPPANADVDALVDFCLEHGISLDWLLLGDLRGLRRMMRWR